MMKKEDRAAIKRLEKIMMGHHCRRCPVAKAAAAGLAAASVEFAAWVNKSRPAMKDADEGGE